MAGFWDTFRDGRNQVRAAYGATLLIGGGRPQDEEAPADEAIEDLQAALQERETALDDAKRVIGELTAYIEQLDARVVELIAGAKPMAKTLRLPGVKTFLLQRFHPDKIPVDADEDLREVFTEAIKTINAAYAVAVKLQTSSASQG